MRNSRIKNILFPVLYVALFGLASCERNEELVPEGMSTGLMLRTTCLDMLPQYVAPNEPETKALTPKDDNEKKINSLHLFFFDENGQFIPYDENKKVFAPYQRIDYEDNNTIKVVPNGAFDGLNTTDLEKVRKVKVFAVANIFGDLFKTPYSESGTIAEIKSQADLEQWVYTPEVREDITQLPKPGMPMIGESDDLVDLTQSRGIITVQLKALMARIEISVKIDASQTSHNGLLPQLTITEYGVKNMPSSVPFRKPKATDVSGGKRDMTVVLQNQPVIRNGSEAVTFKYYTYENIQEKKGEPVYPTNAKGEVIIKEDEKQRWKPTIAKEDAASALVLRGTYITNQNLTYEATFTVYMGENTTDDFQVIRNRCYKNNITIHGLDYVRNNDPSVYTFDGRVNVVTGDNPMYISIVNERKVDAHASVLPMDVYLLWRERGITNLESRVKVSLKHPVTGETPDWIRLEKIDSLKIVNELGGFRAGVGAKDYFTTNLLEGLKTECTTQYSRDRVYFYIDENIPLADKSNLDANGNVRDRSATVYLTYTNNRGEVRERELQIDQKGMLHVTGERNGAVDIYIEYYEEYLEHNDPLDKHEMPGELYSGLPWGLKGQRLGKTGDGSTYYENYHNGLLATQRAMTLNTGDINAVKLYNDNAPISAFHYCYGKNKRDADGLVPKSGQRGYWCLPGISDLEVALVQYYYLFPEFQGNFYWSSSAGGSGSFYWGENENHARATKVTLGGTSTNYAESNPQKPYTGNDGTGGYADRNTVLRIRAAYKLNN